MRWLGRLGDRGEGEQGDTERMRRAGLWAIVRCILIGRLEYAASPKHECDTLTPL